MKRKIKQHDGKPKNHSPYPPISEEVKRLLEVFNQGYELGKMVGRWERENGGK